MISIPRVLLLALAAFFSTYHVVLALFAFPSLAPEPQDALAIALFAGASAVSLWPRSPLAMPVWLAVADLVIVVALPLLVSSSLDPREENGYGTWYVAAVGTLMTVAAARRRPLTAWLGVGFLVVHTLVWAGPAALTAFGVIGSVSWVAIAQLLTLEVARARHYASALESAERAAAEWRAAEEAHLHERNTRLGQTRAMAVDMLELVIARGADLTDEERQECRYLEASVRDEIRGRRLLDDTVRSRIMAARRRGVSVSVLDDGGLDLTDGAELAAILAELARALEVADANRLVVRTGSSESPTAVTVVGLRTADDGSAGALGAPSTEDEVAIWVEIPRRSMDGSESDETRRGPTTCGQPSPSNPESGR